MAGSKRGWLVRGIESYYCATILMTIKDVVRIILTYMDNKIRITGFETYDICHLAQGAQVHLSLGYTVE